MRRTVADPFAQPHDDAAGFDAVRALRERARALAVAVGSAKKAIADCLDDDVQMAFMCARRGGALCRASALPAGCVAVCSRPLPSLARSKSRSLSLSRARPLNPRARSRRRRA
jgi:hypothetical protein